MSLPMMSPRVGRAPLKDLAGAAGTMPYIAPLVGRYHPTTHM